MTPTPRPLPRARVEHLIPPLFDSQALVALVPATGDLRWAAEAAWDVARAAAQGRRVALVDLWIDDPKLHEVVGLQPSDGIVDAFEYGVSLTKAAHEVDRVFFIAAGSYSASPAAVLAHPRWRKLQAGFRAEQALLLLYVSPGGVARLSAAPDGLLVLSPTGYETDSAIGQSIAAALERGSALLGVVCERWTPSSRSGPELRKPVRPSLGVALPATTPRRRARPGVVATTLVVGAAAGWALLAIGAEHRQAPAVPRPHPAVLLPTPRDSLAWTVQLAAYGGLEKALALADRLAAQDVRSFVTPIALEGRSAVWYRVLAGAYQTRDSAAAARAALWQRGLAPRGQGDLLRAPYSLELAGGNPDSLRQHGIPAVRWGSGGRDSRILVGAFETPEQASLSEAQLKRAGIQATLVTRVGTTP